MATTRKVILLAGNAREESGIASAAINPGNLVEMTPNTTKGWRKHSTAGGFALHAFAREQHEYKGHGITDAIASGDDVTVIFPELGAKINVRCVDTVARGDRLTSAGDGTVRLRAAETAEAVVGVANEANANGFVSMTIGVAASADLSV